KKTSKREFDASRPDDAKGLSELSQQELNELLSRLPSGRHLLFLFDEELKGIEGDQRDAAIEQRLQALTDRVNRYEEEIAQRADVEAIHSRHFLAEWFSGDPIITQIGVGIEYLVLCHEQMTNVHGLPPDSLDCITVRILIEFKRTILISKIAETFPEEQRGLA